MPWCQAVQSNISCICHGVCLDAKLYRAISHVYAMVYALMSSCTEQYLMYVPWCMPWCQAVQSNISCMCHGVCFDVKLYRVISHVCAEVYSLMSSCTEQYLMYVPWCMLWCKAVQSNISCMCHGVCLDVKLYRAILMYVPWCMPCIPSCTEHMSLAFNNSHSDVQLFCTFPPFLLSTLLTLPVV